MVATVTRVQENKHISTIMTTLPHIAGQHMRVAGKKKILARLCKETDPLFTHHAKL